MKFDTQNRRSGFVFCCLKPRVKRGVPYSFSDESLWNCKYHIVLAPKYRRKAFYEDKRLEVGAILRELCNLKGVNIIAAEVCPDHVHMFVEIPLKISISSFMGFLKGKSSMMIYERWGNLKLK